MPCTECCEKDERGNWLTSPCCDHSGICSAEKTDGNISNCECCGAEMHKEGGVWWHYSQMEIPIAQRGKIHYGA